MNSREVEQKRDPVSRRSLSQAHSRQSPQSGRRLSTDLMLLGNVHFTEGATEVERLSHLPKGFRDYLVGWLLHQGW